MKMHAPAMENSVPATEGRRVAAGAAAFTDLRPATVAQRKMHEAVNNSPRMLVQRKFNATLQAGGVLQKVKGDADDPYMLPGGGGSADEERRVFLLRATDAVIVPGLAGCTAMKINVFQTIEHEKTLVKSSVLHSEGNIGRTLEPAKEINEWIKKTESDGVKLSVEILVIYNGAHMPALDAHGAVVRVITEGLETLGIPYKSRTETIKPISSFINVDMTGSEEEILARYKDSLKRPAPQEVIAYRKEKFVATRSALIENGMQKAGLENWVFRWGQTESIEQVDALIVEANTPKKAPETTGSKCYLTTACVEFAGLPDDCHELTALRRFRDTYMTDMAGGKALIDEYYAIAPGIVKKIDGNQDREEIYLGILDTVRHCVSEIENDRMESAFYRYRDMVLQLQDAL